MVALDVDGALAIATLSRAPVNAIDEHWLERFDEVLSAVQAAPAVAVLLIRSSERAFSAGADLVGFVGRRDFETFGLPYLGRVFDTNVTIKFFHNDAPCKVCAPYLAGIGINLLNFGVQHTLDEMRQWTGGRITLLGNVPPRDVLAAGTPEDVARAVARLLAGTEEKSRLIVSCGGGMPPGVSSANIDAFMDAVEAYAEEAVVRQG